MVEQTHTIVVAGAPDAGKTNFLIRFWLALMDQKGAVLSDGLPDDAEYLDNGANELLGGEFCAHTPRTDGHHNSYIPIRAAAESNFRGVLLTPDCSGEEWLEIYQKREWSPEWENLISKSCSCLIFIRVDSEDNVVPLDWITAERMFGSQPVESTDPPETPTPVVLVEWLQFLRRAFTANAGGAFLPRIGIIISAWDLIPTDQQQLSPATYLDANFPMLNDYIETNSHNFNFQVFGVSIVDGDLKDKTFRDQYLNGNPRSAGYVVHSLNGTVERSTDLTIPVAWAMGAMAS